MKKVLSFVLVLAMVLGCFSMVFAANFSDVEDGADHEAAINVLSSLGVVSGYTDGTFKPEKVVTRAEMAAFIINALFGEDKQITQRATKFSDVTAAHWASGFVDYANTLGIISGYTDGTFKPDQVVNYNEAITMIVKALGYNDDCLSGTYPSSYVNQAKALGLLKEVDGLGTAGAIRGDIAQLVYNALPCYIGTVNKDGDFVATKTKNGYDSMLARLGGYQDEEASIVTAKDVKDAVVDIADYLGACVKAVRTEEGGDIIGIYDVISTFEEGTVSSGKLNGYVLKGAKLWDGTYNKEGERVYGDYLYFENGVLIESTAAAITGTVKVAGEFSGKYAKTIYSVQVWNETTTEQASKTVQDEIAKGKLLGKRFELDDNDEIVESSFILDGVASLADIKKGDVVTVYVGEDTITKVEVGTEIVTGTISKIADGKPTIDGTSYKLSTLTGALTAVTKDFKNEYDFYLDYAGKIYAMTAVDAKTEKAYGVLTNLGITGATWATEDGDRFVKIFTAEGKEATFSVDEDSNKYLLAFTASDYKTKLGSNKGKLVVYELDEEGVLVSMKLAEVETGDDNINKKGAYKGYYFADDAAIFIKKVEDGKDVYSVLAAEKAVSMDDVKSSYALSTKGKIEVMLITDYADAAEDAVYGILTSTAQVGANKYELTFYVDGEEVTYSATSDEFKTDKFAKVVFSGSKVGDVNVIATSATNEVAKEVTVSTSAAITKNSFVIDGDKASALALDKDVVIYLLDDEGEFDKVGDLDDLEGMTKDDVAYFFDVEGLADTTKADGVYEVVVLQIN